MSNKEFKVGQVWKYNNRQGDDSSTLTILKIEKYERGDTIIHIRVDSVNFYDPQTHVTQLREIGHLPVSKKNLTESVTILIGENDSLPDFSEGYNLWKEAWDKGEAGYFTIDVKEAINIIDSTFRGKK